MLYSFFATLAVKRPVFKSGKQHRGLNSLVNVPPVPGLVLQNYLRYYDRFPGRGIYPISVERRELSVSRALKTTFDTLNTLSFPGSVSTTARKTCFCLPSKIRESHVTQWKYFFFNLMRSSLTNRSLDLVADVDISKPLLNMRSFRRKNCSHGRGLEYSGASSLTCSGLPFSEEGTELPIVKCTHRKSTKEHQ